MPTHPLWNPFETPSEEEIAAARVNEAARAPAPVEVVPPDPAWPQRYAAVRDRIVEALGERVLAIEHVGSTSVPELWAKPAIDVDLTVADSADEDAWLPDLEAAGFVLTVREPEWEEHRCLRGAEPRTYLHVFSPGAREPQRHRMFRDWLRTHPEDRDQYADVKRAVAARGFDDAMLYNNEKAWVVYDIYEKVFTADPGHAHEPHPRACSECGFGFQADRERLAAGCDAFPGLVEALLSSAGADRARIRTDPDVWSIVEYVAHVDEAVRWYVGRIRSVLDEDRPQLEPFDFDAAARSGEYSQRSTDELNAALRAACGELADLARALSDNDMDRVGVGSDGSPRSVRLLLARAEHELVHHELDLRRGLAAASGQ